MNDVLVSYFPGEFGDWLRYFIAERDGFEKFTSPPLSKTLPRFNIDNEFYHTGIDLDRWNTLEEFKSQLIESNLLQVYKPRPWTHTIAHNPEDFDELAQYVPNGDVFVQGRARRLWEKVGGMLREDKPISLITVTSALTSYDNEKVIF